MTDRSIVVDITASVELTEAEVWPDGAPDDWTIDDVRQAMEAQGRPRTVLNDWNLLDDLQVRITDDEDGDSTEVWGMLP